MDKVSGDTALHDEILDQVAHLVIHKSSHHRRLISEAFPETARSIVFAATFPSLEAAGGPDAAFAGVKTEHYFPKGNLVKGTFGFRFDGQWHGAGIQ